MPMKGPLTVLVVDDNAEFRAGLKRLLQAEPLVGQILEAEDGLRAVETASRAPVDVVLMDINMPRMDGLSATAQLTQVSPAYVIMVSVEHERDYFRRAMQVGARDFLVKPFQAEELHAALERAMASRRRASLRGGRPGRAVLFTSFQGGAGCTSLVAWLARLAASRRNEVVAVDLDIRLGNLSWYLGVETSASWAQVWVEEGDAVERLAEAAVRVDDCLRLVPAPTTLEQLADLERGGFEEEYGQAAARVLDAARGLGRLVLGDAGHALGETAPAAMHSADQILVVATPEVPAIHRLARGLELLTGHMGLPAHKVAVVLNRCDEPGGIAPRQLQEELGREFLALLPADYRLAAEACNLGRSVHQIRGRSRLTRSLISLLDAVMDGAVPPRAS